MCFSNLLCKSFSSDSDIARNFKKCTEEKSDDQHHSSSGWTKSNRIGSLPLQSKSNIFELWVWVPPLARQTLTFLCFWVHGSRVFLTPANSTPDFSDSTWGLICRLLHRKYQEVFFCTFSSYVTMVISCEEIDCQISIFLSSAVWTEKYKVLDVILIVPGRGYPLVIGLHKTVALHAEGNCGRLPFSNPSFLCHTLVNGYVNFVLILTKRKDMIGNMNAINIQFFAWLLKSPVKPEMFSVLGFMLKLKEVSRWLIETEDVTALTFMHRSSLWVLGEQYSKENFLLNIY